MESERKFRFFKSFNRIIKREKKHKIVREKIIHTSRLNFISRYFQAMKRKACSRI